MTGAKCLTDTTDMKQVLIFAAVLLAVLFFSSESLWRQGGGVIKTIPPSMHSVSFNGRTMGTSYRVTVRGTKIPSADKLRQIVERELEAVNLSMSTWREDSEISRLNRAPAGSSLVVSDAFLEVFKAAREINRKTNGYFDPTVGKLVNLWGFGPEDAASDPKESDIKKALKTAGMDKFSVRKNAIEKHISETYLDLSGIAKGYGVDRAAEALGSAGASDYLIEIGGEVRTASRSGAVWRVGVEAPFESPVRNSGIAEILSLKNGALATSGTYHQKRRYNDRSISHIINPKTGYPAENKIVSVTVFARSCTEADGFATALSAMSLKEGREIVAKNGGIEALWLVKKDSKVLSVQTSGFAELMM